MKTRIFRFQWQRESVSVKPAWSLAKVTIIVTSLIGVLLAIAGLTIWLLWDEPLASPVNEWTIFQFLRTQPIVKTGPAKVIYGFLPYWNLQKAAVAPELTHIGYFGLAIQADGSLQVTSDGAQTPGYSGLKSERLLDLINTLESRKGHVELVLTQFSGATTASFLSSSTAQQQLLQSLDSLLMAYPFSGINIDIEPGGIDVTPARRDQLTAFVKKLREHLDEKYDHLPLSIDMYASASNNQQIWDVPALAELVDYIVVMAYDFHTRSSPQAGPVAPLFGGDSKWNSDIHSNLKAYMAMVPPKKLLLGVPFYGYEWETTTLRPQSDVVPDTGATASYLRVMDIIAQKKQLSVKEHWDADALSPYLTYQENGKKYMIYYENPDSIGYKLDFVNQLDLAGIAIWSLGYEGESRALWDVIKEKL